MRRLLRRLHSDESGFSLVTALAVSFTFLMLITVLMTQVIHAGQQSGLDRTRTSSFHVAEAGINDAMAQLANNSSLVTSSSAATVNVGSNVPVTANGTTLGTYTVTISPIAGASQQRLVTSIGRGTAQNGVRKIEQTISLVALGSFDYAIFSASDMTLYQHLDVKGWGYAVNGFVLANNTNFAGNVVTPGNVTTGNNSTIQGDIWSGGNVTVASGTTVNGNVIATGTATISGKVTGDVRAFAVNVSGGTVGGTVVSGVNNPAPRTQTLPQFVYNPANYSPVPTEYTSAAAFNTYWSNNRTAMSGVYHVTDSTGGSITSPSQKTTLVGDLTIITDRPITIARDFESNNGELRRLVIISTFPCCSPSAVTWTNNVTPANVETFVYTTGRAQFSNQKSFRGIIYAQSIVQDQYFTVWYEPDVLRYLTGFSWDLNSAGQYDLQPGAWHECNKVNGTCG
jgi:Tfp pilus assembly protein PilX